ncbi:possible lipid asymmetry ABC transporter MlaABCDEF component MlaB [Campylobacter iguaniorum]|uniref:Possible lipid asymmetry ABC transporter MlaABCDEF component MlaB n=1 Tax=Campylobacter iguaniorum TaxID=1244531 RepID=A0A076F8V2_9BACT|nr:hypothetical protein [Campylobacter iguaniorum]AII14436.1 possible lipid asymmetry ABC transporter MlaABCDEF component MlaB [Campylobacter iguaniorum]
MRYLSLLVMAFLMSGCIAKDAPNMRYYELNALLSSQPRCDRSANVEVYVEPIKSLDTFQTRGIIYKQDNQISYLDNSKFIAYPSVMIYKSLISYLDFNCKFKPVLSKNDAKVVLKISLLNLYANKNSANLELFVSVIQNDKTIANKLFRIKKDMIKFSDEDIALAMNQAMNEFFKELHELLKELA